MPINFAVYQMRNAKEHGQIVSLYTDMNDPDAFCSGYIELVNARHVLLCALTPWGRRDGWLIWRISDVAQVYAGDEYETRLDLLVKLHNDPLNKLLPAPPSLDYDIAQWTLSWAMREGQTISILTAEDTFTGKVMALDDLRVTLSAFDFFGRESGQPTAVPLRDVESVSIGTEEERMYDLLNAASDKLDIEPGWWDKQPN